MCRAFCYVKPSSVKCLQPDCATHFTVFSNSSCKSKEPNAFTCRFQLLPVYFENAQPCQLSDVAHTFILTADTTLSSLYRGAKDGDIFEIIVENKHINGLEIN